MMWRWVGYDETDDEEEDKWKKMSCKMKRCEDVDEGESYWRREEHEEEEDVHPTRWESVSFCRSNVLRDFENAPTSAKRNC